MPGKKEAFSAEENSILRSALRRLKADRSLSQDALGALLGMTQQNAARLLAPTSKSPGGMGRSTANALARELGYRDAEHYLLEVGVLALVDGRPSEDKGGSDRDVAVTVARHLDYDEDAVGAVLARYPEAEAKGRSIKWWLTKFGDEERDRASDARTLVKAPKRSRPSAR